MKPKSVLCSSQVPLCGSSIQCPVTAKYPFVLDTCQASQVRLTTTLLFKPEVRKYKSTARMVISYIEMFLDSGQLVLEHVHYLFPSCLPVQYCSTFSGVCSNVNHVAKCWMLERLDRLCENTAVN